MAGRDRDAGEEGKGEEREGNSGAVLTYGGEGQLAGGREGLRCQRGGKKEEREGVYSPMADRAGFGRNPAGFEAASWWRFSSRRGTSRRLRARASASCAMGRRVEWSAR